MLLGLGHVVLPRDLIWFDCGVFFYASVYVFLAIFKNHFTEGGILFDPGDKLILVSSLTCFIASLYPLGQKVFIGSQQQE